MKVFSRVFREEHAGSREIIGGGGFVGARRLGSRYFVV